MHYRTSLANVVLFAPVFPVVVIGDKTCGAGVFLVIVSADAIGIADDHSDGLEIVTDRILELSGVLMLHDPDGIVDLAGGRLTDVMTSGVFLHIEPIPEFGGDHVHGHVDVFIAQQFDFYQSFTDTVTDDSGDHSCT